MNSINIHYFDTPIGNLILGEYNGRLCLSDYKYRKMRKTIDNRIQSNLKAIYKEKLTPFLKQTIKEYNEYFQGQRKKFDIPILLIGTEFQKQVWQELMKIPYGTTCSYLQLAKKIENKKAVRAVASANGANAISILVPCHRIIGSNGALLGYAGGLDTKQKLLDIENNLFTN